MKSLFSVKLAIFGFMVASPGNAEIDYNKTGKTAYAQWECAAYASLTEDYQQEGLKLFSRGYENLIPVVMAWHKRKLNSKIADELPLRFWLKLASGPSVDFSIGYMWAQFLAEAEENTWEERTSASYDDLQALQMINAGRAFREKNCEFFLE